MKVWDFITTFGPFFVSTTFQQPRLRLIRRTDILLHISSKLCGIIYIITITIVNEQYMKSVIYDMYKQLEIGNAIAYNR